METIINSLPYIALVVSIFTFWFTVIRKPKHKTMVGKPRRPTKEQQEMLNEMLKNAPDEIKIKGWYFSDDRLWGENQNGDKIEVQNL